MKLFLLARQNRRFAAVTSSFIYMVALTASVGALAAPSVVSDRLVENLSCDQLSVESIYQSVRDTAFLSNFHLPAFNWNSGVLGQCWSLSHSQRLFFYLGRTQAATRPPSPAVIHTLLDEIRGSTPKEYERAIVASTGEYELQEVRVREFEVFEIPDENFAGATYDLLQPEFEEPSDLSTVKRGFTADVEAYQRWRFYQISNIEMGTGSWSRGAQKNSDTFAQLVSNLDQHRLTLVNLRADLKVQHVVVVKHYNVLPDGSYEFIVYDSNRPYEDRWFRYFPKEMEFDAQGVMDIFYPGISPLYVGAFVVDDGDMKMIDKAMLKYYRTKCAANP